MELKMQREDSRAIRVIKETSKYYYIMAPERPCSGFELLIVGDEMGCVMNT